MLRAWWSFAIMIVRYLAKVLFHKTLIVLFGLYVNIMLRKTAFYGGLTFLFWRLIPHDYSKFMPVEFFIYARHFCGADQHATTQFPFAFRHHVSYNDHHPEHFWQTFSWPSTPELRREMSKTCRRMPDDAVVEMVVDWHAAEISYSSKFPFPGKEWRYVKSVSDNTGLHPVSDVVLHSLMMFLGHSASVGGLGEFKRKVGVVERRPESWRDEFVTVQKLLWMMSLMNSSIGDECKNVLQLSWDSHRRAAALPQDAH